MTLEEKINFINENKNKNYLFVSPRCIQGGAVLVNSYATFNMYDKMDDNTEKFAEEGMINLISSAVSNDSASVELAFNLIFCGTFEDVDKSNCKGFDDFLLKNKDKIVAVYKYVKNSYQRNYFVGFSQSETVYNYGYIYINLKKLLDLFEQNNISYEINNSYNSYNSYNPYIQKDEHATNFIFTYSKNKKLQKTKGDGVKND